MKIPSRLLCLLLSSFSFMAGFGTFAAESLPTNLEGRPTNPLAGGKTPRVLLFITVDCPISNRYAPEIQRLQAQFSTNGIIFWLVYPDRSLSTESIRGHVKEFGYNPLQVLRDPAHTLVQRAGATVTPEAAVFETDGRLIYRGRIDDRFPELGIARPFAHTKDLEQVLQSVSRGEKMRQRFEPATGCPIPDLE